MVVKNKPMNKNRLEEIRRSQHKTQKSVAQYVGVSERTIYWWENGYHEPSIKTWVKLAKSLGVSVPYLQGIDRL